MIEPRDDVSSAEAEDDHSRIDEDSREGTPDDEPEPAPEPEAPPHSPKPHVRRIIRGE